MTKTLVRTPKKEVNQCEGCGVVEDGVICKEVIEKYRGHNICQWCLNKWKRLEKKLGRVLSIEEYKYVRRRGEKC